MKARTFGKESLSIVRETATVVINTRSSLHGAHRLLVEVEELEAEADAAEEGLLRLKGGARVVQGGRDEDGGVGVDCRWWPRR